MLIQRNNLKTENKFFIVIPARSGSKGIPNKNITKLNGISLLHRTLYFASGITEEENICLTTDSQEYINHALEIKKPIIRKRPNHLSQDNSLALSVWRDAIKFMKKQNLESQYASSIYLEPTSPLRNKNWIINLILEFNKSNDDLWMSLSETDSKYRLEKQFTLNNDGVPYSLFSNDDKYSIRQNSRNTYHKDGVFYMAKNEYILNTLNLLSGKIKGKVNKGKYINIDNLDDLKYGEYLLKEY